MSLFFYVHQKREVVCALCLPVAKQGSTPLLTNLFTYPLCFTVYTFCDVTSQLFSLKGGGASEPKNPDPYYSSFTKTQEQNTSTQFYQSLAEILQRRQLDYLTLESSSFFSLLFLSFWDGSPTANATAEPFLEWQPCHSSVMILCSFRAIYLGFCQ